MPEHLEGTLKRATRRAAAASDECAECVERGRVGRIDGQLEQAVHEDGTEELRRASRGIHHLAGSAHLLVVQGLGSRVRAVEAVHGGGKVANDVPFPNEGMSTSLDALTMAARSLLRSPRLDRLPFCERSGALRGHGGQVGQEPRSVPMRTAHAVGFVEREGQVQRLMALRARRRSMLTAHLEEAHREAHHGPHHAVPADVLDSPVTAMPPHQLDGLGVRPSHRDRFVQLLHAHRAPVDQMAPLGRAPRAAVRRSAAGTVAPRGVAAGRGGSVERDAMLEGGQLHGRGRRTSSTVPATSSVAAAK